MALFAEDSFDLPTDPRVIDPGGAPLPPVRRPDRDAAEEQGQNSTPPAVDSLILNSPQRPALTLVPPEPAPGIVVVMTWFGLEIICTS